MAAPTRRMGESESFLKSKEFTHKQHTKFDHNDKFGARKSRLNEISEEIRQLEERYSQIDPSKIRKFTDFPLSVNTQTGLKWAKFDEPTEIQKETIGLALQGHDILGAAKTGSGKTLAFLIPMLENLYRQKWSHVDGMGALIITPTRELAYQIFEVLRKVGKRHDFSAGLVIGGKHVREEAERINKTNIVICTPGRLLQHMDETVFFNADNLQVLVLDEADRILDMGFQDTMNAIIQNLPETRQTWLFSATQTKSVKDLARLSLKDPIYVSVHEHSEHSTPSSLEQSYIVCDLHEKVNMLWSFLKHHLKSKVLIFMSSCKQVKYMHEAFRRIRPGVTLLCLHGDMKQLKRVAAYEQFCRKNHAVLFATDIAARGLDFPAVNWVLQMDCPEDANTYIHRAGRTARFQKDGEALLLLLPSEEEAMLAELQLKKIPINRIKVNPRRQNNIQGRLQSQCAADVVLKEAAQRAFVSYVRSVYLMGNKKVFDVSKLDTDKFSSSLGLAIPPRIRFLQKAQKRQEAQRLAKINKNKTDNAGVDDEPHSGESDSGVSEEEDSDVEDVESDDSASKLLKEVMARTGKSKRDKTKDGKKSSASDGVQKTETSEFRFDVAEDGEDDFLTVKQRHLVEGSGSSEDDDDVGDEERNRQLQEARKGKEKKLTKYAIAKKIQKKNLQVNTKISFDEHGEAVEDVGKKSTPFESGDEDEAGGIDIEKARKRMQEADKSDKQLYRDKIKKKHREERLKRKDQKRGPKRQRDDNEQEAVLGSGDSSEDEEDRMYAAGSDVSSGSDEEEGPQRKRARHKEETYGADWSSGDESFSPGEDQDADTNDDHDDDHDDDDDEKDENSGEFDTGLSLADDELLAMQLLKK